MVFGSNWIPSLWNKNPPQTFLKACKEYWKGKRPKSTPQRIPRRKEKAPKELEKCAHHNPRNRRNAGVHCRAQNDGQQVAGHDDRPKYFLARTNPDFGRSNNEYYNFFFSYGLSNYACNRSLYCTGVQVFGGKLVKNSFTRCWVNLLSAIFAPFHVRLYIPWVSSLRWCLKSPRFVLYLYISETWSFSLAGTWSKVSSIKKKRR